MANSFITLSRSKTSGSFDISSFSVSSLILFSEAFFSSSSCSLILCIAKSLAPAPTTAAPTPATAAPTQPIGVARAAAVATVARPAPTVAAIDVIEFQNPIRTTLLIKLYLKSSNSFKRTVKERSSPADSATNIQSDVPPRLSFGKEAADKT
ncbi:hypothetical protein FXW27_05270 [Candidatus Liberibacter asiaticus]|nr:hypothetical protein FXW27_05270 [Candidatus Liberibacter asiaticus]